MCPWRAEAQVPDWVCRVPWRQLSQSRPPISAPTSPTCTCFLFDLKRAGTMWDLWALPLLAASPLGCLVQGPSLQPPQGISSWGGRAQHTSSQAYSLGSREPPHTELLLPPESCLGQGPGPGESRAVRTLVPCWEIAGTSSPTVSLCYRTHFTIPTVHPSLPTPALSFPESYQWCVGKCLTKALLKKYVCIYICT